MKPARIVDWQPLQRHTEAQQAVATARTNVGRSLVIGAFEISFGKSSNLKKRVAGTGPIATEQNKPDTLETFWDDTEHFRTNKRDTLRLGRLPWAALTHGMAAHGVASSRQQHIPQTASLLRLSSNGLDTLYSIAPSGLNTLYSTVIEKPRRKFSICNNCIISSATIAPFLLRANII
jgi:hypothetical protein